MRWFLSEANPGIDERVRQVSYQVDQHEGQDDVNDGRLQQRVVSPADRLYGKSSDSRPGKYRFDDDRATQQVSGLQAQHSYHGDQRVSQSVARDH